MKSPRRRAREFALQGIYQWQLSGNEVPAIEAHLAGVAGFEKMDRPLFDLLLKGAIGEAAELQALIEPHLDRPYAELSPVERVHPAARRPSN
jgi:N utilization substance protein B